MHLIPRPLPRAPRFLAAIVVGFLAFLLSASTGVGPEEDPAADEGSDVAAWHPDPPTERFEVSRVVDGDTIHIQRNGETQKLRLLSVDTEEKLSGRAPSGGSKPETVFGEETKLWAQKLFAELAVDGVTKVGLLFPDGREEKDIYGRILCHVLLADGTDFNLLLVQEGWSPYFNKYGPSRICPAAFVAAQEKARAEELGIWNPKTNRARTEGAPEVVRDYDRLLPWWDARAAAIGAFRERHAENPTRYVDAEDKVALQAALEHCRKEAGARVEVFGSVSKIFDEKNGDRTVLFRSSHRDDSLRVRIPADAWPSFASLDLLGTREEFRQNFLYVTGVVTRGSRGFRITTEDPAAWRIAAPQYPAPATPDEGR